MTTNELQQYREALSDKVEELYNTLANRRPIATEFTPESCERSVPAAQREFAVVALDRDSRRLREVKDTMARIEDGGYG